MARGSAALGSKSFHERASALAAALAPIDASAPPRELVPDEAVVASMPQRFQSCTARPRNSPRGPANDSTSGEAGAERLSSRAMSPSTNVRLPSAARSAGSSVAATSPQPPSAHSATSQGPVSPAATAADIVIETLAADVSERGATRMDDKTSDASMEKRKKDGYF